MACQTEADTSLNRLVTFSAASMKEKEAELLSWRLNPKDRRGRNFSLAQARYESASRGLKTADWIPRVFRRAMRMAAWRERDLLDSWAASRARPIHTLAREQGREG